MSLDSHVVLIRARLPDSHTQSKPPPTLDSLSPEPIDRDAQILVSEASVRILKLGQARWKEWKKPASPRSFPRASPPVHNDPICLLGSHTAPSTRGLVGSGCQFRHNSTLPRLDLPSEEGSELSSVASSSRLVFPTRSRNIGPPGWPGQCDRIRQRPEASPRRRRLRRSLSGSWGLSRCSVLRRSTPLAIAHAASSPLDHMPR
jgi:hypothetical protein